MTTRIRPMTIEDSTAVATLCGQLGYPATPDQIVERAAHIDRQGTAAVFVAVADGDGAARVVGWIHVAITPVLECDLYAEIAGLVVDAAHRSQGVGRDLVEAAERWAREAGCTAIRVRSRVIRERAHAFYERSGYARIKTQHAFEKRFE